jgi:hypothetical protein
MGKKLSAARKRSTKQAKRCRVSTRSRAARTLEDAAWLLQLAASVPGAHRTKAVKIVMRKMLQACPSAAPKARSSEDVAQLRAVIVAEVRAEVLAVLGLTPAQRELFADPTMPLQLAPHMALRNAELEAAALRDLEAAAANRPAGLWN